MLAQLSSRSAPLARRRLAAPALALAMLALPAAAGAQEAASWELKKSSDDVAAATAAGIADAARDGGKVEAPTGKKIGLLLLSGQSPANQRVVSAAQDIAGMFGYEVIVCDPNFDPQKVAQCATSLVAQQPDAIMSTSQSALALGASLTDAADAGIPWFSLIAGVDPHPALIPYGITGREIGKVYDAWLFDEIKKKKGGDGPAKVMALGAPALGLALLAQQEQLLEDAKTAGVDVTVLHDLDLPNVVQDTLSTAKQTITQHPDLGGTWTVCDFCVPLIAQAFDTEGLTGDDRPVVGGNYTMPQTADLLRAGKVDGVVDVPFEASVYVAFDQLLQSWAREKAINKDPAVFTDGYALTFMEPYMVTKDNIGDGAIPIFGADYEDYFHAKWKEEFGVGG
ncbi:MAG: sugar ABC transporter substrate-binding protein [Rhizobiales bacterium]|nr:sugar ABC transporter substrate-binding protein [Hyphomicrobiales bacterium]